MGVVSSGKRGKGENFMGGGGGERMGKIERREVVVAVFFSPFSFPVFSSFLSRLLL